jgi:hypothetical protein
MPPDCGEPGVGPEPPLSPDPSESASILPSAESVGFLPPGSPGVEEVCAGSDAAGVCGEVDGGWGWLGTEGGCCCADEDGWGSWGVVVCCVDDWLLAHPWNRGTMIRTVPKIKAAVNLMMTLRRHRTRERPTDSTVEGSDGIPVSPACIITHPPAR